MEMANVKKACMEPDFNGNTPPMVAALHNNKEALMAILGPFFVSQILKNNKTLYNMYRRNIFVFRKTVVNIMSLLLVSNERSKNLTFYMQLSMK